MQKLFQYLGYIHILFYWEMAFDRQNMEKQIALTIYRR